MEFFNEDDDKKKEINQESITKSKEKTHSSSLQNLSKLNFKKFHQLPNEVNQNKLEYISESSRLNLNECVINKHLSEKNIIAHDKYPIHFEHPDLKQNLETTNVDKDYVKQYLLKEAYGSLKDNIDNKRPSRKSAKEARRFWIDCHGVEDSSHNLRRAKHKSCHPVKSPIQENTISDEVSLPNWAQKLSSVRMVDDAWINGFVSSEEDLKETIEGHCRKVVCDYIKSHPCTTKKRHIQRNQISRLMWKNARVEFDGIPFTINSSDERRCIFAMNYQRKDKVDHKFHKIDDTIEVDYGQPYSTIQEESYKRPESKFYKPAVQSVKKNIRYKDVVFTDCPAKILIKSIEKYPEYAVSITSLMPEKKAQLSRLREDLQKNMNIAKENLYHITLPLESCHNHPLTGRSRNIHPDIVSKVKEYVNQGYTTPKTIKGLLMAYIETVYQNDSISPQLHDRAYYPEVKDIANIIHTHCKRNGIIGKRKIIPGISGTDIKTRKRLKKKKNCQDESTSLEEAVETFCKDEPGSEIYNYHNTIKGKREREPGSLQVNATPQQRDSSRLAVVERPDVVSVGDMVRSQLDHLRTLTYSINQSNVLCDMYKSIQELINHYGQQANPKDPLAMSEMNVCDVSNAPNIHESTTENINNSKLEAISRRYQSELTHNGKVGVDVSRKVDNLATSTLECLAQAGAIHSSLSTNIKGKIQAKPLASNNNDNPILLKQPFLQSHQEHVSGQSVAYEVMLPHAVPTRAALPSHNIPSTGAPTNHILTGNGIRSHQILSGAAGVVNIHNTSSNMLSVSHPMIPVSGAAVLSTNVAPPSVLITPPPHNISTNGLVGPVPAAPPSGSASNYQSLAAPAGPPRETSDSQVNTSGEHLETSDCQVETSGGSVQLALQHYVYYVQEAQMPEGQSWSYPNNT